ADERRLARQERSGPIVADLEPWLREKLGLISQKTKLAEAIRYTLSRWQGLTRFLDDGRIEIDSNVVERSIRPIALNRKNALFAGSDGFARFRRCPGAELRPSGHQSFALIEEIAAPIGRLQFIADGVRKRGLD